MSYRQCIHLKHIKSICFGEFHVTYSLYKRFHDNIKFSYYVSLWLIIEKEAM